MPKASVASVSFIADDPQVGAPAAFTGMGLGPELEHAPWSLV